MARVSGKSVVEEKGQRTARSTDVYQTRGRMKEAGLCRKCGVLFRNKRWTIAEEEVARARKEGALHSILCPSCQREEDGNPAGIVTLGGDYLQLHEELILNSVRNVESRSRAKNPLGRIMAISRSGDGVTIATTEDKLAQKLGREIFKAHKGDLSFRWNQAENLVRVNWSR